MPSKEPSPYKTISSQVVWTCPWYRIRQDEIITPDGRPGVYNVVEKEDAVFIVPVTPKKDVVLILNYRYTVDAWCWEVPAGSLEADHVDVVDTARAELSQEVGGTAQELYYVGHFFTANGISSERSHVFLATGVKLGPTNHEPTEVIDIYTKPIAEVLRMAQAGEITDGPSALALLLCQDRLRSL